MEKYFPSMFESLHLELVWRGPEQSQDLQSSHKEDIQNVQKIHDINKHSRFINISKCVFIHTYHQTSEVQRSNVDISF